MDYIATACRTLLTFDSWHLKCDATETIIKKVSYRKQIAR